MSALLLVIPTIDVVLPIFGEHTLKMESKMAQLSKGQDQVYKGQGIDVDTGEPFEWVCVFDGHGTNTCITRIREMSYAHMNEIMAMAEPVQNMAAEIERMWGPIIHRNESSGATMCLVKIFTNRLVCINCGDSQVMVFKNSERIHFSTVHDWENQAELARLMPNGTTMVPASCFELVSSNQMKAKYAEYFQFPDGNRLALGQALGHGGRTGYAPDTVVIPFLPTDAIRVVGGSDGLWDMAMVHDDNDVHMLLTMDCKTLLNVFSSRWLQLWNMEVPDTNPIEIQRCRYRSCDCDDISVFVVDMMPIEEPVISSDVDQVDVNVITNA